MQMSRMATLTMATRNSSSSLRSETPFAIFVHWLPPVRAKSHATIRT